MARKRLEFPDKEIDQSGRCVISSGAERCYFPGTMSHQTLPPHRWICRFHWECPPSAVMPVIEESKKWYELSRAGKPVPDTYTRFDGVALPGFRTKKNANA